MKFIKEAIAYYKKLKNEEKMKQRLLDKNMDYAYLEVLIQKLNTNPKLNIFIHTKDGSQISINTYKPVKDNATFNQVEEIIVK